MCAFMHINVPDIWDIFSIVVAPINCVPLLTTPHVYIHVVIIEFYDSVSTRFFVLKFKKKVGHRGAHSVV